ARPGRGKDSRDLTLCADEAARATGSEEGHEAAVEERREIGRLAGIDEDEGRAGEAAIFDGQLQIVQRNPLPAAEAQVDAVWPLIRPAAPGVAVEVEDLVVARLLQPLQQGRGILGAGDGG